jgi:sucrose phosphorylase
MNISYFDALSDPADETEELQIERFIASQAIMLTLQGMPGIYFHSLFGSRGWKEGVEQTGRNRTINRQKLDVDILEKELEDLSSRRAQVFSRYAERIKRRASSPAFNPAGCQEILDHGKSIFAIKRTSPNGKDSIICLQNVTNKPQSSGRYQLSPYQSLWIPQY